jgi:heavy metal sensor kinase
MFKAGVRSVRFRLTGWYVGILALVLVVFSGSVYAWMARDSYGDVDSELNGAVDVLSRSLRHEVEEHEGKQAGEEAFRGVVQTVYRDSFPDTAVGVYDHNRLVAAKPGPKGFVPHFPIRPEPRQDRWSEPGSGGPWRLFAPVVEVKRAGSYQFVAQTSLSPTISAMADLRHVFYSAVPLALLAAALGGWLLARHSLAPVVAMSDAADGISSKDLSQRISAGNPKDELGKLAATFNRLLARLEQSFERQKQFMADSSHELRTPIYVARTAADVTLSAPHRPEEEYRAALETVNKQMHRLSHLVEEMFTLALADAGVHPVVMADFYLDETIGECVHAASILAAPKHITVSGPQLHEWPCHGDEGLMRQLIMILLDNAIKYTPEHGYIRFGVDDRDPQTITLEVTDNGMGIPPEAQPHIFDRFYRVDKTRSRALATGTGGAGLGLAIAKWIAELHGGGLTLVGSGPAGSTFRVQFCRLPKTSVPPQ